MNTLDIEAGETLMTAGEIARMLKISRAKVYRLIQRREIAVVRIGRSVRVIPADFREYAKRAHKPYTRRGSQP